MHRDPGPPGHHHAHMFRDHRWAVAGASAMYVGAAVILVVMAASPSLVQPIDDWWYDLMVSIEASLITGLATVLDVVGGTFVMVPLRVGMAIYLGAKRRWAALMTFGSAIAVSELAIGPLKSLYDRARPPDSLVETSSAAFPSGHATAAAVTAIILVVVLISPGEHRRAWEVRAGLFAFAMALSRTYLRAHWLSDVVAGALIGAATALAAAAVVHVVRVRIADRDEARVAPNG
ncbi:MAG: phosphatase PAP2 family protein [Acidimicrobiia bacterium]|nr:phosphatase PAP2 family protein [Acidimicrobiia bacterium]